ncbi:HipA N-terminal domain-containing protein [Arthrobacter sp. MA-N2]|uniref:HipA N-terminal domain-containing protein n=1 Tax=Arthrobacter sp. MA-N2 TaxID=1101188 RepID=UPI0004875F1F
MGRRKIDGTAAYNYFDGLLPEGQLRSHLASENRLSTLDALGLLAILGADCAGAVQALPSKVLLSRHGDGWAWPGRGAVSIHIIKPEPLAERPHPGSCHPGR